VYSMLYYMSAKALIDCKMLERRNRTLRPERALNSKTNERTSKCRVPNASQILEAGKYIKLSHTPPPPSAKRHAVKEALFAEIPKTASKLDDHNQRLAPCGAQA
jgi:hypothetical protein